MARNYLRPHEVQRCESDKKLLESTLANAHLQPNLDKAAAFQALRTVDEHLKQAPPDLSSQQLDRVDKRIAQLEEQMRPGMLSRDEMMRNPPGAVDQNILWERANKARILEWKNLQVAKHKGASQQEVAAKCRIARLRPGMSHLPMEGAQISRTKEMVIPSLDYSKPGGHYDRIFGARDDALPTGPAEPGPKLAPGAVEVLEDSIVGPDSEFGKQLDASFGGAEED